MAQNLVLWTLIKINFQNTTDLIKELPLTVKSLSNHFETKKKLGLKKENTKSTLENFRDCLEDFDNDYDYFVKST